MRNQRNQQKLKFEEIDKSFHEAMANILKLDIPRVDLVHQFPIYTGHVNLARYLFFYDLYKRVYKLAGHIADIGTWKGASFMFMAKLVKLFEGYSDTQVHGFDWFKGMKPSKHDDAGQAGVYASDYSRLVKLIQLQNLNDTAVLHKLDLTKDLPKYFKDKPYLRYKFVFIDCGIAKVLNESLKHFWPRLVKGGILILDHYNSEASPMESEILESYIGENKIEHWPITRWPTAFIVKNKK